MYLIRMIVQCHLGCSVTGSSAFQEEEDQLAYSFLSEINVCIILFGLNHLDLDCTLLRNLLYKGCLFLVADLISDPHNPLTKNY